MDSTRASPFRGGNRRVTGGLLLFGSLLLVVAGSLLWFSRKPAVPSPETRAGVLIEETQLAVGQRLYGNYCTQCHGDQGGGDGPAARFLYPKPRNFREGRFRVVTAASLRPSDQDLLHVISRGMPGSAMFPFAHLGESERQALVAYVRHLNLTSHVERQQQEAASRGESVDVAELTQEVEQLLQAGPALEMPSTLSPSSSESVARGQQLYTVQCVACHGPTGKGDGVQDQRDDLGMPIRPRDFTHGIFKGGRDPQQLYARIVLGMPGTPMPASPKLQPNEVGDLINFVLSLSGPAVQAKVEHRRTQLAAKRVPGSLTGDISDADWQAAQTVPVVVSPLWWRQYTEPELQVAALHDGQTLAVRLTWQDDTRDDRVVRPQDFEDMAALQLFKGTPEPFLGMGATDKAVDVWLWRAGWQAGAESYADVDTVYPHMAVDLYPFEQAGDGPRPHATERQPRDFITARAAGNLRADPTRTFTASSLQAKGFGTSTMRPRISQVVSAKGLWKDNRWTVVLRRPLGVKADAGVPLAPGDKLSIAFALWNGAAGDRNGQKLISIWHDLQVE
jgi:mono/diheme cytochrome c family protein